MRLTTPIALACAAAVGVGWASTAQGTTTPAPVNPDRSNLVATARPPVGGAVRLEVRDGRGRLVVRGRTVTPRTGVATLIWDGRDARQRPAADGPYRLWALTTSGQRIGAEPSRVIIDRTPPRLRAVAPTPRLPARPGGVRLSVAAHNRQWGSDVPKPEVRLTVETLAGSRLAAGRWYPAGAPVPMPDRVLRSGRAGAVRVTVDARDAAGNRAAPVPLVVSLPGPGGSARLIHRVQTPKRWVALTIDDGYQADIVRAMADFARNTHTPLTFCLNGAAAEGYADSVRRAVAGAISAGWIQACSHGRSHATGAGTPFAAAMADLVGAAGWDRVAGQSTLPFYRPPYGAHGPGILSAATRLGYRDVLLWSIDTNDWRGRSAAAISSQVVSEARPGSIILMHALPQSLAALPSIVAGLSAKGLRPVLIGDLLASGRPTG